MIAFFLITSCAPEPIYHMNCESSTQCSSHFGLGSVCGADGFCEDAVLPDNCLSIPEGIDDDWSLNSNAILVGQIFDHSENQAQILATKTAFQDFQTYATINDKELTVISCDIQETDDLESVQEKSAAAAKFMNEDLGVHVIVGPADTDSCIAAFDSIEDTVFISPSASASYLENIEGPNFVKSDENPGMFWRTVGSDSLQASAMLKHMTYLMAPENILILYQQGIFGDSFASQLVEEFQTTMFSGTVDLMSYDSNLSNLEAMLNSAMSEPDRSYDTIAFISESLTENILFTQLAGQYPVIRQITLTQNALQPDFLQSIPSENHFEIWGSSPSLPINNGAENIFGSFSAVYESITGNSAQDSSTAAFAYDVHGCPFLG